MAKAMTREERLAHDQTVAMFSGRPRVRHLDFNGRRVRLDPVPGFSNAFAGAFDADDLFPDGDYQNTYFAGRCPRKRFLAWARRADVISAAARGQEAGWGQYEWVDALYDKAKIWPDGTPATVAVLRRPRGAVYVFGVKPSPGPLGAQEGFGVEDEPKASTRNQHGPQRPATPDKAGAPGDAGGRPQKARRSPVAKKVRQNWQYLWLH